jgi:hypothetical protein
LHAAGVSLLSSPFVAAHAPSVILRAALLRGVSKDRTSAAPAAHPSKLAAKGGERLRMTERVARKHCGAGFKRIHSRVGSLNVR